MPAARYTSDRPPSIRRLWVRFISQRRGTSSRLAQAGAVAVTMVVPSPSVTQEAGWMIDGRSRAGHAGVGIALSRRARLYATRNERSIVRLAKKPARTALDSASIRVWGLLWGRE